MAHKLADLRAKQKAFKTEADGIFAMAEKESDAVLTAAQEQRLSAIEAEIKKLDGEIDAEIAAMEPSAPERQETADPKAAAEAERERSSDILAACQMFGKVDKAAGFIASGKPLSEVYKALQAERASESDKNETHAGNPARHSGVDRKAGWDKAVTKHNQRNGFK
ncbi:hypothetical protein V3589_02595 [Sinorhizobium fredii]|uniref:hypothetical protein n=1 Tax=Rhizobium fredii TaxID=380 RepID=UPI0030A812E2